MSNAHKGSRLILSGNAVEVDFNSIYLDYNFDTSGIQNGQLIEPTGTPVYTMHPNEGRFGGAIAIEEGTTNLSSITANSAWANSGNYINTLPNYVPDSNLNSPTYYLTVNGPSGNNIGATLGSATNLVSGTVYSTSMWVWADTVNGESGSFPYVRAYSGGSASTQIGTLYWYDESGNAIYNWSSIPQRQWINLKSENITFPSGYNEIRCSFYLNYSGSTTYFTAPQVEQKVFCTSFVSGNRAIGSLNYPQIEMKNNFTVSAWVKCSEPISDFATYHKNALCYFTDPVGNTNTIEFFLRGNQSTPKIAFWTPSTWHYGNAVLQPKIWYHVAWTFDGANVRIYVNGSLDSTIPISFDFQRLMNFSVGGNTQETLNGLISDLKIDMFTSSDEDIMAIYTSNRPLFNPFDKRAYAL